MSFDFAGFPLRDSLPRGFAFKSFLSGARRGSSAPPSGPARAPVQAPVNDAPAARRQGAPTQGAQTGPSREFPLIAFESLGKNPDGRERIRLTKTGGSGEPRAKEMLLDPRNQRSYDHRTGQFSADPNAGIAVFNAENNYVGGTTRTWEGATASGAATAIDAPAATVDTVRPGRFVPMVPPTASLSGPVEMRQDGAMLSQLRSREDEETR